MVKILERVIAVIKVLIVILGLFAIVGFILDLRDGQINFTHIEGPATSRVTQPTAAPKSTQVTTDIPLTTLGQEVALEPPTQTPARPTLTPEPPIAIPTVMPTATIDTSLQEYRIAIQGIMLLYAETGEYLANVFLEISETPTLIVDNDWKFRAAFGIAAIRDTNIRLRAIVPPARAIEAHSDLIAASEMLDRSTELYATSIDNLDSVAMDNATQLFNEAVGRMRVGTDKLLNL